MIRLTYIASPYSARDPSVMQYRANKAMAFCAWAARQGTMHPLSPIVSWHEAATRCGLPTDAKWWRRYNNALFSACGSCCLLTLQGWKESVGVAWELDWTRKSGKPLLVAIETDGGYDLLHGAEAWRMVEART